jgi:hypothetical protein
VIFVKFRIAYSPPCRRHQGNFKNILAHVWSVESAQTVIGSSCLIFDVSSASVDGSDMSQFLAVA